MMNKINIIITETHMCIYNVSCLYIHLGTSFNMGRLQTNSYG